MQSLWNVAAWVVTHDFCPWANAWCYWIKKPIAILAVAFVAAIACAVFVNPVALISGVAILGVIVSPDIVPLGTLLDAAETRPTDDTFAAQRVGDSGDMAGTRSFRNGDSLRRVHWAQTARTGAMVVCERESPVLAAVRVVFDSDPAVHDGDGTTGTLEWSIRIAASVCSAYH